MVDLISYVARNPFRIVGVFVDDVQKCLDDNVAELMPMVRKGLSFPFPTDRAEVLGPLKRTEHNVGEALKRLDNVSDREFYSLLWFYRDAPVGSAEFHINRAVECIIAGKIDDARREYESAFALREPSDKVRQQLNALLTPPPAAEPTSTSYPADSPSVDMDDEDEGGVNSTLFLWFTLATAFSWWLIYGCLKFSFPLLCASILILCVQGVLDKCYGNEVYQFASGQPQSNGLAIYSAALPFLYMFLVIDVVLSLMYFDSFREWLYENFIGMFGYVAMEENGSEVISLILTGIGVLVLISIFFSQNSMRSQKGLRLNRKLLAISWAIVGCLVIGGVVSCDKSEAIPQLTASEKARRMKENQWFWLALAHLGEDCKINKPGWYDQTSKPFYLHIDSVTTQSVARLGVGSMSQVDSTYYPVTRIDYSFYEFDEDTHTYLFCDDDEVGAIVLKPKKGNRFKSIRKVQKELERKYGPAEIRPLSTPYHGKYKKYEAYEYVWEFANGIIYLTAHQLTMMKPDFIENLVVGD